MNRTPVNLEWTGNRLRILDQRALPSEIRYLECSGWQDVVGAIRTLAVRGAPAIGIAGAYGVALAASALPVPSPAFRTAADALAAARPTAVNLPHAVRMAARGAEAASVQGGDPGQAALGLARCLHETDARRCARIAALGADLLCGGGWVLTHCHTGSLATGGVGTALGAVAEAFRRGVVEGVYACEARPLWQGARLTAWECGILGIPCRVLVDAAAGGLLAARRAEALLVGADRIAANGDTANKVGTYPLAVLAQRHHIPFYVLAPSSSIDASLASGQGIVVEERAPAEVLGAHTASGAGAYNPAFDVTPGGLVSAIVTEGGVYRRPYRFGPAEQEKAAGA